MSIPVAGVRTTAPVAPTTMAPGLPHAQWSHISDKILEHGTYRPPDYTIPATMGLESIRGIPEGTREADYVNLWGYKNESGQFIPLYATFVSEDWVLSEEDGNFHIEQWIHRVDADGRHQRATYVTMVQTPEHRVLDYDSKGVDVTHPSAARNLNDLGAFWERFAPSKAAPVDRVVTRSRRAVDISPEIAPSLQLSPPRR